MSTCSCGTVAYPNGEIVEHSPLYVCGQFPEVP